MHPPITAILLQPRRGFFLHVLFFKIKLCTKKSDHVIWIRGFAHCTGNLIYWPTSMTPGVPRGPPEERKYKNVPLVKYQHSVPHPGTIHCVEHEQRAYGTENRREMKFTAGTARSLLDWHHSCRYTAPTKLCQRRPGTSKTTLNTVDTLSTKHIQSFVNG